MIHLTIHALPKLPNQTLYKHWRIKQVEAKKWKAMVMAEAHTKWQGAEALKKASVTLTRHSTREPDADNLMASWKHCIDGLVLAGIIENDKPSVIGTPISLWCFSKRKDQRVEIKVEKI